MDNATRHNIIWRPSRRDVLLLGVGGFVAAVPFARRRPLPVVRRNVLTMGTIAEFAVAHREPAQAHAAIDRAVEALRFVDDTMSRFKPSSDVGRANLRAAHAVVGICADTRDVLNEGLRWADASGGAFDPCIGRATALWDVTHRKEPPATAEVTRIAGRALYRQLEISERAGSPVVRFHDPDVQIDLGGIAKGYAVDRAVAALRKQGVEHALVGAGGDIYALGTSPSGEPWRVGIQSPDDPNELAGALRLENAAIATSGDYRQFFEHGQRRYHHLLDPSTAAPRQSSQRSISVIAETCMAADAAATLAFGTRLAGVERILAKHGARIAHRI
ncbi:MAG TPA: FAD:protein FMN transferase [Vicinamibacterales bacterium]|nr:FAD:protein FMN transferase [Vicinamibacterales bacterium]